MGEADQREAARPAGPPAPVGAAAVPFDLRIRHVPREQNKHADRMVNEALDKAAASPNPVDLDKAF